MEPCGLASRHRCTFFCLAGVRNVVRIIALATCIGFIFPNAWAAPAPTTTTLTVTSSGSDVTSVTSGTVVTLTATVVSGSTPVNPGQVKFCDALAARCEDSALLATVQLASAGTATYKFRPGPGSQSYQAVFVGTNNHAKSASTTADLTVSTYPTITTITSSGTVGDYTLTATVMGTGSRTLTPTGNVSFLDVTNGDALLGTAALGNGTPGTGFSPPAQLYVSDCYIDTVSVGD